MPRPASCSAIVIAAGPAPISSRFRDGFAGLANVTVLHHATVVELASSGEPPMVERVRVATGRGRQFSVSAARFVLAAGGIENPRLMLAAGTSSPAAWATATTSSGGSSWSTSRGGTTRMDDEARRSAVDRDGRVHGVRNLWVAGNPVFPTGGWINPTLTIVAMAVRLADHLRSEIATPGAMVEVVGGSS